MLTIKDARFVQSIVELKSRPHPLRPEFAFAGRSNVGKSSLINSLLNRKNIAKISKSPGKTRTINYFLVNHSFYLVDLPGYGYAKVPENERLKWGDMIENFILRNNMLRMVYVLIDIRIGIQEQDFQLLDWLNHHNKSFCIILTKSDKISKNKQIETIKWVTGKLVQFPSQGIILFSVKQNKGRAEVLEHVARRLPDSS